MTVLELDRRTIGDALDAMRGVGSGRVRTYAAGRVDVDLGRREAYSYGRHFPLFRYVPRGRRRPLVVLNGDVWRNGGGPSRTADHQSFARDLAERVADTLVIPFSALDGAGVELDSIRPLDVRPDHWTTVERVERDWSRVPSWRRSDERAWSAVDVDGAPVEWTWTDQVHRLGESLFTAVRLDVYTRPARPFETDRRSSRVDVDVSWRDSYCNARDAGGHETGPSGACVYCGRALDARVTVRRRGLYLSSFDYLEPAPLYFLAEVPRGRGAVDVDSAIDALAPRAIHAARARSIPVERQGDLFFVRTTVDAGELMRRGIVTRARLTQWTRDARARAGETGYRRPLDAAGRRRMDRYRRAEWRRLFGDASAKVTAPRPAVPSLKRDRGAPALVFPGPRSPRGARALHAKRRAEHAAAVDRARANLRALVFGRAPYRSGRPYPRWNESRVQADRRDLAERVRRARVDLDALVARTPEVLAGRAIARDAYRTPYRSPIAAAAWGLAGAAARARFIPHEYDGAAIERRREQVRRALSIYGTAHSATEVLRTRSGAVYVRGTVRHVPELEAGRGGTRDHAALLLEPDVWYLAVRNAVPRQTRRRSA